MSKGLTLYSPWLKMSWWPESSHSPHTCPQNEAEVYTPHLSGKEREESVPVQVYCWEIPVEALLAKRWLSMMLLGAAITDFPESNGIWWGLPTRQKVLETRSWYLCTYTAYLVVSIPKAAVAKWPSLYINSLHFCHLSDSCSLGGAKRDRNQLGEYWSSGN